jgi:aspartyl-tRNA(Asn)/glutamyl-tRNA(Gln) amidotransferase subunit B
MEENKYQPTIGLEIHIRLNTETKMFCPCKNDSDEKQANKNVCPICLAHPGTLPVINEEAVKKVIMLGFALGGNIAENTHFDRKSYFYPDLPKGFQISQYDEPIVSGGNLKGFRITRVHLEEDAGSLVHSNKGETLVDYNRAGTPLAELVTEPDMRSADDVVTFAKELQLIARYLGISNADMEKGEMRVEANVSLNMGTKVELKNINSFRAVSGAINYEIERQKQVLEEGGKVEQVTRGWDPDKQKTYLQRSKEEAFDYRYFPEPDLPPLNLNDWDLDEIKSRLPELPKEKRERFIKEYKLTEGDVETLINSKEESDYFEQAVSELKTFDCDDIKTLYNYLTGDLRGLIGASDISFKDLKITPENFAEFVSLVSKGELSSRLGKDMLKIMFETGRDPSNIKEEGGFEVIGGGDELNNFAEEVVSENEKAVSDYKKGKTEVIKFMVGQIMKKSRGQADPQEAEKILKDVLDNK